MYHITSFHAHVKLIKPIYRAIITDRRARNWNVHQVNINF